MKLSTFFFNLFNMNKPNHKIPNFVTRKPEDKCSNKKPFKKLTILSIYTILSIQMNLKHESHNLNREFPYHICDS